MNQNNTVGEQTLASNAPYPEQGPSTTITRLEIELEALSGRVLVLAERTERLPGEINRLSASIGQAVAWIAVPLWVIVVVLAAIAV
jgi:hypothetical protein